MIVKKWKQCICSSTDEWIDDIWYIHKMESYLAIIRNEVLIHTITLTKLEKIIS